MDKRKANQSGCGCLFIVAAVIVVALWWNSNRSDGIGENAAMEALRLEMLEVEGVNAVESVSTLTLSAGDSINVTMVNVDTGRNHEITAEILRSLAMRGRTVSQFRVTLDDGETRTNWLWENGQWRSAELPR